ncbi:host attachment protein [Luteithermobacter gelatinilyticus]|uniref:host attachment protein n=1 Tax=Luteithermobacter gelatinilyticus TaxID=2582913 RepID=UPI001105AFDC|nr:host attachment protein [Luteithermobacter gelatinilyticus]|tara:strand:+ start:21834 stop:22277 length:444 start_codon:yes stop_codon:yes gene_type:complete
MIINQPKCWIAVADGSRARFFLKQNAKYDLKELEGFALPSLPSREIDMDQPGRQSGGANGSRHAMEPRNDAHDLAEEEFAREMVKKLNEHARNKDFEKLILIAAPKTLGHMRKAMEPQLKDLIETEIPSDLTKMSAHELKNYLQNNL